MLWLYWDVFHLLHLFNEPSKVAFFSMVLYKKKKNKHLSVENLSMPVFD